MENILLVIHLILALCLIAVVLLQRSEGGGLGIGGGGGGLVSQRGAANALTKLTWMFAIGFLATSIILTVLAARETGNASVIERVDPDALAPAAAEDVLDGDLTLGDDDGGLAPPTAE